MSIRNVSIAGIAGALVIGATPAWADYGQHYGHQVRHYHPYRPALVVVRPPVVHAPPRAIYVPAPPVYYAPPAPAYYGPRHVMAPSAGAIGGALLGAAIGSSVGQGNGRAAAIAVGSIVGALAGDRLTMGR